ncbi:MAG: hypothetical protein DRM97_06570 [Thermoprotei archaeon]|nr:MAG: hypothetical protein DRJ67_01125 [Thermoprotei archaeon]RLF21595.1 MAG: hypothetical protein DRM97_06570 [Thermoprotei archaeon]
MSIRSLEGLIPPIAIRVDDATVTIYEVIRSKLISGETWYHVTVDIFWRGKRSRRFSLDVRSWNELRKLLLIEVSKFKWMNLLGVEP